MRLRMLADLLALIAFVALPKTFFICSLNKLSAMSRAWHGQLIRSNSTKAPRNLNTVQADSVKTRANTDWCLAEAVLRPKIDSGHGLTTSWLHNTAQILRFIVHIRNRRNAIHQFYEVEQKGWSNCLQAQSKGAVRLVSQAYCHVLASHPIQIPVIRPGPIIP